MGVCIVPVEWKWGMGLEWEKCIVFIPLLYVHRKGAVYIMYIV